MFVGRVFIPAPHGQLEAIYKPVEAAQRVALVLHPHPLYGGTMHNKVVARAAKALETAGYATLRFNFRGVENSTGAHDGGRGELDDARVALDYLLAHQPQAREALVAGYSFGAAVGLRFGCADPRVQRMIAIATPARWLDGAFLAACKKPVAYIHGDRDDVAPLPDLERLVGRDAVHVIAGADHFFNAQLDELQTAVNAVVVQHATGA
jgi:uncharacterized protein